MQHRPEEGSKSMNLMHTSFSQMNLFNKIDQSNKPSFAMNFINQRYGLKKDVYFKEEASEESKKNE